MLQAVSYLEEMKNLEIVGTVIALKQRLKEIEGGEIYEARKY